MRIAGNWPGSLGISVIDQHIWAFGVGRIGNPTYIWRRFTLILKETACFANTTKDENIGVQRLLTLESPKSGDFGL